MNQEEVDGVASLVWWRAWCGLRYPRWSQQPLNLPVLSVLTIMVYLNWTSHHLWSNSDLPISYEHGHATN